MCTPIYTHFLAHFTHNLKRQLDRFSCFCTVDVTFSVYVTMRRRSVPLKIVAHCEGARELDPGHLILLSFDSCDPPTIANCNSNESAVFAYKWVKIEIFDQISHNVLTDLHQTFRVCRHTW